MLPAERFSLSRLLKFPFRSNFQQGHGAGANLASHREDFGVLSLFRIRCSLLAPVNGNIDAAAERVEALAVPRVRIHPSPPSSPSPFAIQRQMIEIRAYGALMDRRGARPCRDSRRDRAPCAMTSKSPLSRSVSETTGRRLVSARGVIARFVFGIPPGFLLGALPTRIVVLPTARGDVETRDSRTVLRFHHLANRPDSMRSMNSPLPGRQRSRHDVFEATMHSISRAARLVSSRIRSALASICW